MIDMLVTLLPEPDSPTMPRVLPRSTSKERPSTDLDQAVVGGEVDAQVAHRQEGVGPGAPSPPMPGWSALAGARGGRWTGS